MMYIHEDHHWKQAEVDLTNEQCVIVLLAFLPSDSDLKLFLVLRAHLDSIVEGVIIAKNAD